MELLLLNLKPTENLTMRSTISFHSFLYNDSLPIGPGYRNLLDPSNFPTTIKKYVVKGPILGTYHDLQNVKCNGEDSPKLREA